MLNIIIKKKLNNILLIKNCIPAYLKNFTALFVLLPSLFLKSIAGK